MAHVRFYSCAVLVICSLYLGDVDALRCYETQVTQPDHSVQEKTCDATWNACSKTVTTGNTTTAVLKACDLWNGVMNCTSGSLPPFTVETCFCNTDLCNSAGKTAAYSLMGFGAIVKILFCLF